MSKHTTGPWIVGEKPSQYSDSFHVNIYDRDDLQSRVIVAIACGPDGGDDRTPSKKATMANARLIADAPAMHDALAEIARIIEAVDNRCLAADGPVTPTLQEMTQAEISRIYALSTSKRFP